MEYFTVKLSPEGLEEMREWAKENLDDELLDQFADKLDKVIVFGGFLGAIIEASDARVFKMVLKHGVDLIFKA